MSKEIRYTKEHEWAAVEGNEVRIGITNYAQSELGDVVFVDLPEAGREVKQGQTLATVESVKAVSEVYAPISGVIHAVNTELAAHPELVNQDPMQGGWFCTVAASDKNELAVLMSEEQYKSFIAEISK